MKISLIVAMAENRIIGRDNAMPWHLPGDLRFFKRVTLNKPVIMGRNTFESIGKPLVERPNIVVTRNPDYRPEGVTVANSLEEGLAAAGRLIAATPDNNEVMIIGGGEIYAQALPLADRLYLTEVHAVVEGDASFPAFERAEWREVSREDHLKCERNPYDYSFLILEKQQRLRGKQCLKNQAMFPS